MPDSAPTRGLHPWTPGPGHTAVVARTAAARGPRPPTALARCVLASLLAVALAGCAAEDPGTTTLPRARGTHEPPAAWASARIAVASTGRGLAERRGEVVLVEGDGTIVSGQPGDWGLRVDAERHDVARVVARAAAAGADVPGVVVLYTTFEDRGAGGAGYFLPIFDDTPGTGLGPVDERLAYGAQRLEGVVNLKQVDQALTIPRADLVVHELAHRHAAHLAVQPSSTTAPAIPSLLGRQAAHWHAALHSEASLLDGYAWLERAPGRFVVVERARRLGSLDLYALGLLPAAEVPPFFFVAEATTVGGAPIPAAAQLAVGTEVLGVRVPLTVDDVVRALGPRPLDARGELRVALVLLTAPGEGADDPAVLTTLTALEAERALLEGAWARATGGRGWLCTRLDGCPEGRPDAGIAEVDAAVDAGAEDSGPIGPTDGASDAARDAATDGGVDAEATDAGGTADGGCACTSTSRGPDLTSLGALVLVAVIGARRRSPRARRRA